jgi:hypothetical protein
MICDVHAHYTPRNFSEFMGDRFASPVHLPVKRGMARHPFSDSAGDIEGRFTLTKRTRRPSPTSSGSGCRSPIPTRSSTTMRKRCSASTTEAVAQIGSASVAIASAPFVLRDAPLE